MAARGFVEVDSDLASQVTTVYHEKQVGDLCGLHVVNNILQQNRVSREVMDSIGEEFDIAERNQLNSNEPYESPYFSPSGDYNVDVITRALSICNVQLQRLANVHLSPPNASAFAIQFDKHWLALRKIGSSWWNLNSVLQRPFVIPNFNIANFITKMEDERNAFQEEGQEEKRATVFCVDGHISTLPVSNAN